MGRNEDLLNLGAFRPYFKLSKTDTAGGKGELKSVEKATSPFPPVLRGMEMMENPFRVSHIPTPRSTPLFPHRLSPSPSREIVNAYTSKDGGVSTPPVADHYHG